mgnify:CR=1 FL=1
MTPTPPTGAVGHPTRRPEGGYIAANVRDEWEQVAASEAFKARRAPEAEEVGVVGWDYLQSEEKAER